MKSLFYIKHVNNFVVAISEPKMNRYDLHTHTKYSIDGVLEPRELVKRGQKRGLAGIAVTDHNTIRGGLEAKAYECSDFKVIVGSEIMTTRGELIGLFLHEEVGNRTRDFRAVIDEIKDQGGIVIVPHPFDTIRRSAFKPRNEDAELFDGVEGLNSRCFSQSYNDRAVEFAIRHDLPITAGSDAHFGWEVGNAYIRTNASSDEELKQAILTNRIEYAGKLSSPLNLCMTKLLKTWRKIKTV